MPSAARAVSTRQIEEALEQQAGINAVVEAQGGRFILSGKVESVEQKQAAQDLVALMTNGAPVDNDLEVERMSPVETSDFYTGGATSADVPDSVEEINQADSEIEPDFTEARSSQDTLESAGVDTYEEEDTAYMPPTDPVVTTDQQDNVRVLNGFAGTSMDDVNVPRSVSGRTLGDGAIAEAILEELRQDASTTELIIHVTVVNGVAHLHGTVTDLDDAENAQAVASRVPGVTEVVDDLNVAAV